MNANNNMSQLMTIWNKFSGDISINRQEEMALEIEFYKKIFNIFQVGEYYYFIFNVSRAEFDFVSANIQNVLGYPVSEIDINFFIQKFHPDDLKWYVNAENLIGSFLHSLPKEKMFLYKIRYDLRIQKSNGEYARILSQTVAIDQNDKGEILKSFAIHTDITHLKNSGKPSLSFIGLEGEPSYIDVQIGNQLVPMKEALSKREKEVLLLIIEGKLSKEISHHLKISKETVDRHRKNMVRRNGLKNTGELIAAAIKNGWI